MNIVDFLKVYQFDNKKRLGVNGDGGYVVAELNEKYDCYISAGVSNEESFSRDFINSNNMQKYNSYAFDGTINIYPYQYTDKITFIKKNIGNINDEQYSTLSFLIDKYSNIFLKMDIEGGEYTWLLWLEEAQLKKFKQIVIEFHGINDNSWGCSYNDKIKCLEKLANTHYIVHAHGNNFGGVHNNIPDVIELTYVNKDYFDSVPNPNTHFLPANHLDYPNRGGVHDINLNVYPFVNSI
jgi:hypothetical protein